MFLSRLLPSQGLYCVALLLEGGTFRHFWYEDLPAAQQQITTLDTAGHTVYIAQATFDAAKIAAAKAHNKQLPPGAPKKDRMKIRGQANAALLKNFFLDIDCGEKWPIKKQEDGCLLLTKFVREVGLPMPAVVNSGNGLYAHWILSEPVPADKWRTVAFLLKQVVAQYAPALGGDASRTSDSASVLRPPGVRNRKPGRPEKPVLIIHDPGVDVDFLEFAAVLGRAAKKKGLNVQAVQAPRPAKDINADFLLPDQATSDPNKIADRCAQLAKMRTSGGDISEPLWYACLGLLSFCLNGEQVAHEWSKGYSGYSHAETEAKIEQWRGTGMGPTTCAKFGSENAAGCIGCARNGKIKSPIVLGRPDPVAKPADNGECAPPDGFRRAADGLFHEEEGIWFKFYDQDLYPSCLAWDESLGYEVMTLKHCLPYEGMLECTVRSSLTNDPKTLLSILSDNHIKVVGVKEKKCMVAYLESYQSKLQRQRRMTTLLCQMGWKTGRNGAPMFVLGRKIFHADGQVEDASMARNVPSAATAFKSMGTLERWSEATRILARPGMEQFAFALLAGGFGAPLMKFSGFAGALLSLVGESGVGKTLMLRFITSIWGYHNDLIMLRDDTKNAMVSRLGVYGNLPFVVDEVTNIDGKELSDFVYKITQGRDKNRLTKNSEEKRHVNNWHTIGVATSNTSLVDKLSGSKMDASAELNRVFEYTVDRHPELEGQVATDLFWTLDENYGHAGEIYAKWLVENEATIKAQLQIVKEEIDKKLGITGEERFWSAVVAVAAYGGLVAEKLGLIRFPVQPVLRWAAIATKTMRDIKMDLQGDSLGVLGQIIDSLVANRVLVKGHANAKEGCLVLEAPRGPLHVRYEVDKQRMFISRNKVKEIMGKGYGSYTNIKTHLGKLGVLVHANVRKALGAGTFYGGAQQPCWEIDMRHPQLTQGLHEWAQIAEKMTSHPMVPQGKGGGE